jgi:hypothetical protein
MLRGIENKLDEQNCQLVALKETVSEERKYDENVVLFFSLFKYVITLSFGFFCDRIAIVYTGKEKYIA